MPFSSRRRKKKTSICGGQQRDVTALKPAASSVASDPSMLVSDLAVLPPSALSRAAWRRTACKCDSCNPSGKQVRDSSKFVSCKFETSHLDLSDCPAGAACTCSIAFACTASADISAQVFWSLHISSQAHMLTRAAIMN